MIYPKVIPAYFALKKHWQKIAFLFHLFYKFHINRYLFLSEKSPLSENEFFNRHVKGFKQFIQCVNSYLYNYCFIYFLCWKLQVKCIKECILILVKSTDFSNLIHLFFRSILTCHRVFINSCVLSLAKLFKYSSLFFLKIVCRHMYLFQF